MITKLERLTDSQRDYLRNNHLLYTIADLVKRTRISKSTIKQFFVKEGLSQKISRKRNTAEKKQKDRILNGDNVGKNLLI